MEENKSVVLHDSVSEAKIIEFLDNTGITSLLLDNEKKMFVNIAKEFGLNPFKREIHITAYGKGELRKCSIITGYEVYIKRAERTEKLDGWKAWTEGEGKNLKAIVEIYRKDRKYPFTHEVFYSECVQCNKEGNPNAVWAKQPRFMTKKVAIGQAFRLCFSDELGGMPYEEAELPREENLKNVTEPENIPEEKYPDNEPPEDEEKKKQLKKEAWELIKLLPAEKQGEWIGQCKDARIDKLEIIIERLNELFEEIKQQIEIKQEEIPIF